MNEPVQTCPGCASQVRFNPRYPGYFCRDCALLTCDSAGRRVAFTNVDPRRAIPGMSVAARYAEDGADYRSEDCFVLGIASRAREARFGGVVIQPVAVWERTGQS